MWVRGENVAGILTPGSTSLVWTHEQSLVHNTCDLDPLVEISEVNYIFHI